MRIRRLRKNSKKYNIPDDTLRNWIDKYKSQGFENLSKKLKNIKRNLNQARKIKNRTLDPV